MHVTSIPATRAYSAVPLRTVQQPMAFASAHVHGPDCNHGKPSGFRMAMAAPLRWLREAFAWATELLTNTYHWAAGLSSHHHYH